MSEYCDVPKRLFKADAVSANSKNVGPTVNAANPNRLRKPRSPLEKATATSPVARLACHELGKACSDLCGNQPVCRAPMAWRTTR